MVLKFNKFCLEPFKSASLKMLKFKKTGETPSSSPAASPLPSPRRPKLFTRLDSLDGTAERKRVSLFENDLERDSDNSERSSSSEEFATPGAKLRDVTKSKLNRQKKKLIKLSERKPRNLLSTKDFFYRQHELKIWIHETTGKDVAGISEKKLMEYFKKFISKWNKKKLPQKYYRGVDLHSSPLPAASPSVKSTYTTPKQCIDGSSLWIAPPIPLIEHFSDNDHVTSPLPVVYTDGSSFGQKFATITRAPTQSNKLCLEERAIKTPPPPPPRKRPHTIITSLSASCESLSSNSGNAVSNISGVKFPQPRMGSLMSSMRHSKTASIAGVSTFIGPTDSVPARKATPDSSHQLAKSATSCSDSSPEISNRSVSVVSNPSVAECTGEKSIVEDSNIDDLPVMHDTEHTNMKPVDEVVEDLSSEVTVNADVSINRPQGVVWDKPSGEMTEETGSVGKELVGDIINEKCTNMPQEPSETKQYKDRRPIDSQYDNEEVDSQPSPNKRTKWVDEVESSVETYV